MKAFIVKSLSKICIGRSDISPITVFNPFDGVANFVEFSSFSQCSLFKMFIAAPESINARHFLVLKLTSIKNEFIDAKVRD